jgi:CRP-like cAMP-binding protein
MQNELSLKQPHLLPENLLAGLEPSELKNLASFGAFIEYTDYLLVEDGSQQKAVYIILDGEIEIFKYKQSLTDGQLTKQSFCILKKGDCFGEMSFLSGGNATASAYSLGSVKIWQISHVKLEEFITSQDGGSKISLNLAKVLSNRLDGSNQKVLNLSQELSDFIQIKSEDSKDETALQTVQSIESRLDSLQKAYGLGHKSKEVSRVGFYFALLTSILFCIFSFYSYGKLSDRNRALNEKEEALGMLKEENQFQRQELKSLHDKNEKIWENSQQMLVSYQSQVTELQNSTQAILDKLANGSAINDENEVEAIRNQVEETNSALASNQEIITTLKQLRGENVELRKLMNARSETAIPNNRYAIIRKSAVIGSLIDHPYAQDTQGNQIKVQVPSAYFFYCLSEKTKTFHTYEVSEIDYIYYQKGEVVKAVIVDSWKNVEHFPTMEELNQNYLEKLITTERRAYDENYEYKFNLNVMPIQQSYTLDDPDALHDQYFKSNKE